MNVATVVLAWLGALVFAAFGQPAAAPTLDGAIGEAEWTGAVRHALTGGGELRLLTRGEFLYVAVEGRGVGLASLCSAKGNTVRILHASAALGEGRYQQSGERWTKGSGFDWRVRDSFRTGPAPADESAAFLRDFGWLANSSAKGAPHREFQIRASDVDALAVTFLTTNEPMTVAYWPGAIEDDCRSQRVAQGFLPDTASFNPATWHSVRTR